MANILCVPPGCSEYPAGVREIDGVPIVDVVSTAVRTAEVLVSMKRAGVPWISRKRTYRQPSRERIARVEAEFPYHGGGSWHHGDPPP